MIGYLRGKVHWVQGKSLILEVQGIGYLIEVAGDELSLKTGEELELYIYTYVREDLIALYGFKTMEERELFTNLLGVAGIGPRAALNILSSLPAAAFINAILTENIAALKQISGIGNKTAQRLILELKNKVSELAGKLDYSPNKVDQELYQALESLGYTAREVDEVLAQLDFAQDSKLEEKIRKALSFLAKES